MNIGFMDGRMPHDAAARLAQGMAERVRVAHQEAAQDSQPKRASSSSATPKVRDELQVGDGVGVELRRELEEVVADVIAPDASEPEDLVGEVIDRVVTDRMERSKWGGDEHHRRQITDAMRHDPVVVAEIDDLLRDIARDLALQQS